VQAEPEHNPVDSNVTLREVLDRAAAKVGGRFQDQPDVEAAVRETIAWTYHGLGVYDQSERHWRAVAEIERRRSGPESADTWAALSGIGHMLNHLGRNEEAVELLGKAHAGQRRMLGPDHPDTLNTMSNLATAYQAAGRFNEAVLLCEETLKLRKAKLGPEQPNTLTDMNNLGLAYRDAGRLNDAVPLFEETLKLQKAKLGPDHPKTLTTMNNLAVAYRDAGRLNKAVPLFEETLKLLKAKLGPDHPKTLTTMNSLAGTYLNSKRWAEALATARECLELRAKKMPDDWWRFYTMSQLGAALTGQTKYAEAEPMLLQGYDGLKAREAKIPAMGKKFLAEAAARIVPFYEAWGKKDKADEWRAKLQAQKAIAPPAK
jgi:eukaryotic-like serine/threonine-protein kinase